MNAMLESVPVNDQCMRLDSTHGFAIIVVGNDLRTDNVRAKLSPVCPPARYARFVRMRQDGER